MKGAAWAALERGDADGVVTTGIEHKAVLGAVDRLRRQGARVTVVPATAAGTVDVDRLAAALDDRTAVVSVMLVNNETGIVQPLDEVAALVRDRRPARRAAHRRGAGAAVARCRPGRRRRRSRRDLGPQVRRSEGCRRARSPPRCRAGAAGRRRRSRVGAARRHTERRRHRGARRRARRDPRAARGGDRAHRRCATGSNAVCSPRFPISSSTAIPRSASPGCSTSRFPGVEAETLLVALDQEGIEAASGSACSVGRDRSVARARRDGPRPAHRALVGSLQPRLRVGARRRRRRARRRAARGRRPPRRDDGLSRVVARCLVAMSGESIRRSRPRA